MDKKLIVKFIIITSYSFLFIFPKIVHAKYPQETDYSCESYDGYINAVNNENYCCPANYNFEKDICYKGHNSIYTFTIYGANQLTGTTPRVGVFKTCYYELPFAPSSKGPARAKEVSGVCERTGQPPEEVKLFIDKSYLREAEESWVPCKSNECRGEQLENGIQYCYELGDSRLLDGYFCGCDCSKRDWSTLGFHKDYCSCTGDKPDDPTDPSGSNTSPPPEITCKDLCSGEGTFVDSDNDPDTPAVFVPGEQYANCCMCVCGTSDCPDDLDASRDVFTPDVWTELGCISASKQGVVISIMRIFVGAVLGIGLLRFIQAAFMLNTDDPEKIKEGKSIFISAVMAIVLGVMMPILINFLGLDILGIGELFSF